MASLATRRRPGTSAPGDGSRTITITNSPPQSEDAGGSSSAPDARPIGALHLRGGGPRRAHPRVAWDDDVIDNEGCGRKSSKICCIYHKPKNFDESSDEDSSDSDSDSDYDDGRARRSNGQNHNHSHHHPHPHPDPPAGGAAQQPGGGGSVTELELRPELNAYELAPAGKKGKGKRTSGTFFRRNYVSVVLTPTLG
ncbi:phosphatase inhibitor-domain-containing protein [Mycena sp. CBHHK59/15]|nr:phosphatase inhibitor-domain-containing protein [Mycena sp. CBHHK59/15]